MTEFPGSMSDQVHYSGGCNSSPSLLQIMMRAWHCLHSENVDDMNETSDVCTEKYAPTLQ